jgi:hypothetical protein
MDAKPELRRFRFGLRGLIILTTVVALYFACWWPTTTAGVNDVERYVASFGYSQRNVNAVAPLLITSRTVAMRQRGYAVVTRNFLWAFGWMLELPSLTTSVEKPYPPGTFQLITGPRGFSPAPPLL